MILMPLPKEDFDPSEAAITWKTLTEANYSICIATPDGKPATADLRMITGKGLFFWSPFLRADPRARRCYAEMIQSPEFLNPISYEEIEPNHYQGILLPGGHAPKMREYLESKRLQEIIVHFFETDKPVGAICHGVLLVARSRSPQTGKSVLYGRKTTTLQKDMELSAWLMTCLWLKNYYRTYPVTTQEDVCSYLKDPNDFKKGPFPLFRDSPNHLFWGFVVRDGNYVSGRWPGDAHRFAQEFLNMIDSRKTFHEK